MKKETILVVASYALVNPLIAVMLGLVIVLYGDAIKDFFVRRSTRRV